MVDVLQLFGRKLADIRNKKGLTQEDLAEIIGYSANHISKIELSRANPSFDLLLKVTNALDIDIKDLFDFRTEQSEEELKEKLKKIIEASHPKKLKMFYNIIKAIEI